MVPSASPHDPSAADGVPPGARVVRGPVLRALGVVLLGVLVGFAAVDRAVAFWDADQGADGGEGGKLLHPLLGWIATPHFENAEFGTALDRYGLRNPEIPADAPPDELRIAGFGASRLYGAGGARQEHLWNYQLEAMLAERTEPDARVLNGGVMAYSTLQACRRAALLLDALQPDLVFVIAAPGAQLMLDPSAARRWVRYGPGRDDYLPADLAEGQPDVLLPAVAALHRFGSNLSGIYRRHRAKFQSNEDRPAAMQRWTVSNAPRSAAVDELFGNTLREAEALGALCKERGVELVMLVLPEVYMDSDRAWRGYLRANQQGGAPPVGTPRAEPTNRLEELLQERGLTTWNFFEEMTQMGLDREAHTMPDGRHWSQLGHGIFARGLLRRLTQEGHLERLAERRRANPRREAFGPSPFAVEKP